MVQGKGVEPLLPPYQGGVLTVILPLHMAGTNGIEPILRVLETPVLPLNYIPIFGGDREIRTLALNK